MPPVRSVATPAVCLGLALVLAGCRKSTPTPNNPIERIALPGEPLRGLSGLARVPGEPDRFFSVAERLHHVIPVRLEAGGQLRSEAPIPVEGVDADLDLEGLAFLGPRSLVFATEADKARNQEWLLFAEWEDDSIRVKRRSPFSYGPWGLVPVRNMGLEGVCAVPGTVVAASEMVGAAGSQRWSPVGAYDLEHDRWRAFRIHLTSDTGKISALTCTRTVDGITVTAIERHFDLLHVVRFVVPDAGGEADVVDVVPTVLADLRPRFHETPPNFEGIEQIAPGRFVLITDNDWRGVRGPTEVVFFEEREPGGAVLGSTTP